MLKIGSRVLIIPPLNEYGHDGKWVGHRVTVIDCEHGERIVVKADDGRIGNFTKSRLKLLEINHQKIWNKVIDKNNSFDTVET